MIIDAHLLCYNEKDIMPFVIKHYASFCDRVIIHDNHSTDGSAELARSMGCEVIPFGDKFFNDQHNMDEKNDCWKGLDADWVIVSDMDEILFSNAGNPIASILATLEMHKNRGTTILHTIGWQIMSEEMPKESLLEISNGYEFSNYAKSIIFNPKALTEINYGPGAHDCSPEGNVVWSHGPALHVLHYKHIGGVERTIKRYKEYMKRMSKVNLQRGWGIHYKQNEKQLRREWAERMSKSVKLF